MYRKYLFRRGVVLEVGEGVEEIDGVVNVGG